MSSESDTPSKLKSWVIGLYAFPGVAVAMTHVPTNSILPTIYATNAGIDLVTIGTILFIAKALDAIADPLMGIVSDRTQSRFGRRKPWIALGGALLCVAVIFLYAVPEKASATYFTVWYILTVQCWTMLEIPYRAWGIELSRDYTERTRIMTYLGMGWAGGQFLFLGLPFLPLFASSKMDAPFMRTVSWMIVALLLVAIPLTLAKVPNGKALELRRAGFGDFLKALRTNKPLQLFIVIFLFGGLGGGIMSSLVLLYMTSHLQIGDKFTIVMFTYSILHLVATPLTLKLVPRFGKARTWAAGWLISALVLPLIALIEPGPQAFVPFLAIICIRGFVSATDTAIPTAILGDIVDYDLLRSGVDRAANYVACLTLILKFNHAIGTAAGFLLLGLVGYQATGNNTPEAARAFTLLYCFGPTVLYCIACFLLWKFPIDARRHGIIRRRIEQRAARLKVATEVA